MPECGETAAQWAPTAGSSVWSGTLGSNNFYLILSSASGAPSGAVGVVGIVPVVGTWGVDTNELVVSLAAFGITYLMNGPGECDESGNVVSMTGTATDALFHANAVSLTRVV